MRYAVVLGFAVVGVIAMTLAGINSCAPKEAVQAVAVCAPKLDIKLTPAPAGETPLERWRRTKADYDAAQKAEESVSAELRSQTFPALEAYMDSEKELQKIQCGKLCAPPTT